MNDFITVRMRLKQNTIEKVKTVSRVLNTDSRADAVRASIDIADLVTEELDRGSQIIIYPPWWKFWKSPERIIIPPLNH